MPEVQRWPWVGLTASLLMVVLLDLRVGLSEVGWVGGGVLAVGVAVLLGRALVRTRTRRFGSANAVTLSRSVLTVAVAALAVGTDLRGRALVVLVSLAALALVLDLVDGRVARRTGTVSTLGARFDMEVDALLVLVLSVAVVRSLGWSVAWVLVIGAARYLLLAAAAVLPWLREPTPVRPWAKVVAAVQGVALTVVVAGVLPRTVALGVLVAALALLSESFGWQVRWLWRHRARGRTARPAPAVVAPAATAAAALVVWAALVLPDRATDLSASSLLRVPLEGAVLLGLAVLVPPRAARAAAVGAGLVIAVVVLLKVLEGVFWGVFDRPFDLLNDGYYLGPGFGVLVDSIGRAAAVGAVAALVLAVVALAVTLPWSLLRLARVARGRRALALGVAALMALLWVGATVTGARIPGGAGVATASTTTAAYDQVTRLRADLADRKAFGAAIRHDPYANVPPDRLLTALRGKDVLLVFVESYGRVAVEGSRFSPAVSSALVRGTQRLTAAGYATRSAYLTSPTFGGGSWLAHATMQSGLWVDSQQRYDQLLSTRRLTLSAAFGRAGWRTVLDAPATTRPWPQGARFYGVDRLYGAADVGYRGPAFSYATMPDQYVLAALHRLELAGKDRRPVMAEIDLVSSHHPWTPLPRMVGWDEVGDGSVFDDMPSQGLSPRQAVGDPDRVRELYGRSIVYSWQALVSYLDHYRDPNLVVIALGDHQPHRSVSGRDPGRDVPVSVIAQDPQVLRAITGWDWRPGLLPAPDAPVWPMDRFRNTFLRTFSLEGRNPS
ncbi:CDP-alcohol phosphatidyltransferase family protein [Mumia sp. ZJ1417]|uniref:CDP-alcohol phosphatidyltransferase family protein n=1 Tax=Mumia sp. ZJ1417 TaxID=2708082 RepID=UPI001AB05497|nr:CDP-alcohol phosphatidyltransferase family protein [Mumia sp. ZJ1417]